MSSDTADPSVLRPILLCHFADLVPSAGGPRPARRKANIPRKPVTPASKPAAARPRLLDLFCGAGGAARGYHQAGFDVLGVDKEPQKNYPFESVRADALAYLTQFGGLFDAIHASPPCQRFSKTSFMNAKSARRKEHPDLLTPVREILLGLGKPWIIENVQGAPMQPPAVKLCGLMFGLRVFRHRWFESSEMLFVPHHPSHAGHLIGKAGMCCVVGNGGGISRRARECRKAEGKGAQPTEEAWEAAMGIDWMTRDELSQSIPPAYTRHLGVQLMRILENTKGDR